MYDTVIFDFFGVFCSEVASAWFRQNVPDYESKLGDLQALCTQSDLGKLPRVEFYHRMAKLTGIPAEDIETGMDAQVAINTALVDYTLALRAKGYKVACLSNGSHEWTLRIINDTGVGHLFDDIILSSDLGLVKPDPQIYLQTLDRLHITASHAVFVDDRKVNTDAAEALGIRSLVFTDTPTFITDFEALTAVTPLRSAAL